jgi:hypothetical protein
MSAKKKRQDALKAKEKKQKIIAAVGGVILLGLLAFQVPRVMKQMNRGGSPPPAAVPQTVSTPTTTPSLEAPTTLGGQGSTGTSSGSTSAGGTGGLITATGSAATQGQLASFSRFESKDPFSQQVKNDGGSTGGSSGSASSSTPGSGGSSGSGTTDGSGSGSGSQPSPADAVISVNGTLMSVTAGSDFPQPTTTDPNATPLFHLVSLTMTTARISIAGGSYTSGAGTVTLRVNKPVTLMNTADGSRYKLILKPQGTPLPGQSGTGGTSTTPTVTLPAPSP